MLRLVKWYGEKRMKFPLSKNTSSVFSLQVIIVFLFLFCWKKEKLFESNQLKWLLFQAEQNVVFHPSRFLLGACFILSAVLLCSVQRYTQPAPGWGVQPKTLHGFHCSNSLGLGSYGPQPPCSTLLAAHWLLLHCCRLGVPAGWKQMAQKPSSWILDEHILGRLARLLDYLSWMLWFKWLQSGLYFF